MYNEVIVKRIARESRVTLDFFCSLCEDEQEKLIKSCIRKRRYSNMRQLVKVLVNNFDKNRIVLTYYKCQFCNGFHLTSKKKRFFKYEVLKLIKQYKYKIGETIPEINKKLYFRESKS